MNLGASYDAGRSLKFSYEFQRSRQSNWAPPLVALLLTDELKLAPKPPLL